MLPLLAKLLERARAFAFVSGIAVAAVLGSLHVWSAYDTYRGLSARGAATEAVITDIAQGRGRRMVGQYSFATPDGVRAGGHFSISADAAQPVRAGQRVRVVYDRANPAHNAMSLESAWLSLRNGAAAWLFLCPGLLLLGGYVLVPRGRASNPA